MSNIMEREWGGGRTQWLALKQLSLKCRLRQVKQMAMRKKKHVSLQWPCLASLFWLRDIHLASVSHREHHSITYSETAFSQASGGHSKVCNQTFDSGTVKAYFGFAENVFCFTLLAY